MEILLTIIFSFIIRNSIIEIYIYKDIYRDNKKMWISNIKNITLFFKNVW